MKLIRKSVLAISLVPILLCFVIPAQAEEESYYLEKMRNMAKNDNNAPSQELAPILDNNDLIADTDLKELSKTNSDFSKVGDIKPTFEKPKLDILKPQL